MHVAYTIYMQLDTLYYQISFNYYVNTFQSLYVIIFQLQWSIKFKCDKLFIITLWIVFFPYRTVPFTTSALGSLSLDVIKTGLGKADLMIFWRITDLDKFPTNTIAKGWYFVVVSSFSDVTNKHKIFSPTSLKMLRITLGKDAIYYQ